MQESGAVLGIDVGWSPTRPTTGLCLLRWTGDRIEPPQYASAWADADDRRSVLARLTQGQPLGAVAVDGPLVRGLGHVRHYRLAEELLSKGAFQRRGKPGQTSAPLGQRLHHEATKLSHMVIATEQVGQARHARPIHPAAVVEAFPNAFLAVMHPEAAFATPPSRRRRWTDLLFPGAVPQIAALLGELLPDRALPEGWDRVRDHDHVAALVCALTALCVLAGRYVAVGDDDDGSIILPPVSVWGPSDNGPTPWAEDAIRSAAARVDQRLRHRVRVFQDNELWDL